MCSTWYSENCNYTAGKYLCIIFILVYKSVNNVCPTYVNEFFTLKLVKYNLRGSSTRLEQPHFNLEWFHRSFSYIAFTVWNNLPVKVRESEDVERFKRDLRDHTFL